MCIDESKILITYVNYKGGINNLVVAHYGYNGIIATSTKNKSQAIKNLKRKLKKINY